jgi:riboflavin synthase
MFTGIIEQIGEIQSLEKSADGGRLRVHLPDGGELASSLKVSDSIAVSGCCLTVVQCDGNSFEADLSGETLRRTSLGEKKPGQIVNIERPLAVGARLGGHFVQGHVDGVGRIAQIVPEGGNWWLSVGVPEPLQRYVAEKGSISIDGVSLTVARWQHGVADIAVIPFTYDHTSIRQMTPGDAVNLETDILAKYVEQLIKPAQTAVPSRVTVSRLIEEGF